MGTSRQDDDRPRSDLNLVGQAWTLIGAMIGCPLIGYVIGKNFDRDTLGVTIGVVVGFIYFFYELWKFLRKGS